MIKTSGPIFTNTKTERPKIIKVIRKKEVFNDSIWWSPRHGKDKFYSSIVNEKQYIYSFLSTTAANRCYAFLKKYKEVNGRYPDLNGSHSKLNKNTDENCLVYIDEEYLEGLKQRCLLNGIGLIGISNFEYTFIDHFLTKKNVFNLNVSAVDLLENENINCDQQIDNLNYLLDF